MRGHAGGDGAVRGNDTTEGGNRIAGVGLRVRIGDGIGGGGGRDGHTAGVGVLDDRDGGFGEVERGPEGGVGVDEVVVAHGLAVQLVGLGDAGRGGLVHVQRGLLVRVFPVAEHFGAFQREAGVGGPVDHAVAVLVEELGGGPAGHGGVVGGGVREGLGREPAPGLQVEATGCGSGNNGAVGARVHDDGDGGVVLRGGPHHGGTADVDLLDDVVLRGTGFHGLHEGVEVHDDEVEGFDLHAGQRVHVGGDPAVREDAAVDARVQGLDPAVEHFRRAGDFLDFLDRDAGRCDLFRGGAGRDDPDAGRVQALREFLQAGLVVDRNQCPSDGYTVDGYTLSLRQDHKSLRLMSRSYVAAVPRAVGMWPVYRVTAAAFPARRSMKCPPACWPRRATEDRRHFGKQRKVFLWRRR